MSELGGDNMFTDKVIDKHTSYSVHKNYWLGDVNKSYLDGSVLRGDSLHRACLIIHLAPSQAPRNVWVITLNNVACYERTPLQV